MSLIVKSLVLKLNVKLWSGLEQLLEKLVKAWILDSRQNFRFRDFRLISFKGCKLPYKHYSKDRLTFVNFMGFTNTHSNHYNINLHLLKSRLTSCVINLTYKLNFYFLYTYFGSQVQELTSEYYKQINRQMSLKQTNLYNLTMLCYWV